MTNGSETLSLRIQLCKSAPEGLISESVGVGLSGDDQLINVPVRANLRGPITISPATLQLRRKTNGEFEPGKILVWRTDGVPLGKLRQAEAPKEIEITQLSPVESIRTLLAVRAVPPTLAASVHRVRVWFAGFDIPADLKIRLSDPQQLTVNHED